jgi:hypothetical protein
VLRILGLWMFPLRNRVIRFWWCVLRIRGSIRGGVWLGNWWRGGGGGVGGWVRPVSGNEHGAILAENQNPKLLDIVSIPM